MMTISRNELQGLLTSYPNLKLIDVLPEAAYREFHLRGAINVPLDDRFEEHILKEAPDKYQTIIVYSLNFECKISEQAMQWLLKLNYQSVYDYEPGKIDWNAAQLPIEHGDHEMNSREKQQGFHSFVE